MKAQLTLKDWLAKYYPVPANSKEAKRDPIGHSLRKWRGLRENVLARYGLRKQFDEIRAGASENFYVDSLSCALCVKYMKEDPYDLAACEKCPLFKALGRPCDYTVDGESPYRTWITDGDAEPMIRALVKTRKKYGKKE